MAMSESEQLRKGLDWEIPGRGRLSIRHVVFDFNGTLAAHGHVAASTADALARLAQVVHCIIATADTFGTVSPFAARLGLECSIVAGASDKLTLVQSLRGGVAAVGNGANDGAMLSAAQLAIGVIGPEGAAMTALRVCDVVVHHIDDALGLLLNPDRLVATLRE